MKRLILIIWMTLSSQSIFAQLTFEMPIENQYFALGVTPTTLLDPFTPTTELTADIAVFPVLITELKVGLPFDFGLHNSGRDAELRNDYFEFKGGVKYMTNGWLDYIGLEYIHVKQIRETVNGVFEIGGYNYNYSTATVTRKINGGRFRIGKEFYITENFVYEVFAGLGIRHSNISQVSEDLVLSNDFNEWQFFNWHRRIGSRVYPDVALGFKFRYQLINW